MKMQTFWRAGARAFEKQQLSAIDSMVRARFGRLGQTVVHSGTCLGKHSLLLCHCFLFCHFNPTEFTSLG
jgi:hypothetical protein